MTPTRHNMLRITRSSLLEYAQIASVPCLPSSGSTTNGQWKRRGQPSAMVAPFTPGTGRSPTAMAGSQMGLCGCRGMDGSPCTTMKLTVPQTLFGGYPSSLAPALCHGLPVKALTIDLGFTHLSGRPVPALTAYHPAVKPFTQTQQHI